MPCSSARPLRQHVAVARRLGPQAVLLERLERIPGVERAAHAAELSQQREQVAKLRADGGDAVCGRGDRHLRQLGALRTARTLLAGEVHTSLCGSAMYMTSVMPHVEKGIIMPLFQTGLLDDKGDIDRESFIVEVKDGKQVVKAIVVPNKLVNIVVR